MKRKLPAHRPSKNVRLHRDKNIFTSLAVPARGPGTDYKIRRAYIAPGPYSLRLQAWDSASVFNETQLGNHLDVADVNGTGAIGQAAIRQGSSSINREGVYIYCHRFKLDIELGFRQLIETRGAAATPESCRVRFVILQIMDDSSDVAPNAFTVGDFFESSNNITTIALDSYKKMDNRADGKQHAYKVLCDRIIEYDARDFYFTITQNPAADLQSTFTPTPSTGNGDIDSYQNQASFPVSAVNRGKYGNDKCFSFQCKLGQLRLDENTDTEMHDGPRQRIIYGLFTDTADQTNAGPFYRGKIEYMWTG